MSDNLIWMQFKLLRFAILPGILGGIACFIGPPHSALIKANIGVVIGFSLQHRVMVPAIKNTIKASEELLDRFFEDED
ncbi:MAG: hypothetical protein HDS87_03660 [Bacteroidales bacterium]|nr:hypothetical protein [Bacteroidales bacterium]